MSGNSDEISTIIGVNDNICGNGYTKKTKACKVRTQSLLLKVGRLGQMAEAGGAENAKPPDFSGGSDRYLPTGRALKKA